MLPALSTHLRQLFVLSTSVVLAATLAGCGAGAMDHSATGSLALHGSVHGGQQPVSGSIVRLYTAGTGGNGTAAVSMLKVTSGSGTVDYVTSDGAGNFNITGDYSCVNSTDQVYITASNGNPGLSNPNGSNPALVMMTALGNCGALLAQTSYPFITINEVTTVAAAWALAPFISSASSIASSASNSVGITNAFLNASLLANPATGAAATLPANLTVETGKLYALANTIAACVNSDGTSACSPLFAYATPPNGTAPKDTLTAALDIVRNPGNNVAQIFESAGTQPPFATTLITAPNDWTMSMTVTGGGLALPTALSVDTAGNVWVADYENFTPPSGVVQGAVSSFTPQGTPKSPASGFTTVSLNEVYGLTVDSDNNVWATDQETVPHGTTRGSVALFFGIDSNQTLGTYAGSVVDASIDFPESLATDTNKTIIVGNYANGSASVYNNVGTLNNSGIGSGYATLPTAITADGNHGVWFANNGANTATHVDVNNNLIALVDCCSGPNGIARDSAGNVWVSNYYGQVLGDGTITPGSFSEISDGGTILINQKVGGGITHPAGVRVDAGQNIWIANYFGNSFTGIAGYTSATPGAFLSPSTGYGLDAKMVDPFAITPDASGNLWVTSYGTSSIVMFFGLATPTATPAGPAPLIP
jgi:hypothetical protein